MYSSSSVQHCSNHPTRRPIVSRRRSSRPPTIRRLYTAGTDGKSYTDPGDPPSRGSLASRSHPGDARRWQRACCSTRRLHCRSWKRPCRLTGQELLRSPGPFRDLVRNHGTRHASDAAETTAGHLADKSLTSEAGPKQLQDQAVTQELEEERETGSVALGDYTFWLSHMGPSLVTTMLVLAYTISAAISIANILWLKYWQTDQFDLSREAYQGVYAGRPSRQHHASRCS